MINKIKIILDKIVINRFNIQLLPMETLIFQAISFWI